MTTRVLTIVAALTTATPPPVQAQDVRLYIPVDTVSIGERFEVAVAVERTPGVQVLFTDPRISDTVSAGDAALVRLHRHPTSLRATSRVDSATYTVAVFAVEHAQVGPVRIGLAAGSDTSVVVSPVAIVAVRPEAPHDAEVLHGVQPFAAFPRGLWPWLVAAAFLLVGLIWGARHLAVSATPPPREMAPRLHVLTILDELQASPPRSLDQVSAYYVALSDAVRRYLGHTFCLPALEMTTDETFTALGTHVHPPPKSTRALLHQVLERADLVKFAGYLPPADEHTRTVGLARRAVQEVERAHQQVVTPAQPVEPENATHARLQ